MRPREIELVLEAHYRAMRSCNIEGSPGVGKSAVVKQVAVKLGIDCRVFMPSQHDRLDLTGLPYVDKGKTKFAPPDFLPQYGAGFFFVDELNAAPREMQPTLYQLLFGRRIGEVKLGDGWLPVSAGNLSTDRAIVNKLSTAINSRLSHYLYEVHLDDWCSWAFDHNVIAPLIAFLRFRPELLHKFEPDSKEKPFPCPRTWEFTSDIIKAKPDPSIRLGMFAGTVGQGAAAELEGFLRVWSSLPSLDAILLNPATADLPSDNATLYAVAGGLARKSTDKNFDRVMTYASRMPLEWQTFLVKDASRRNAEIQNTTTFIKWASDNSEAMG